MATALVALGSNLDDPRSNILHAIERLEQAKRVALAKQSELMSFAPVGGPPDQPAYWNAAVLLETEAGPADVMAVLSKIEREMGRRRNERWAPRTIDLDLLLYGDLVLQRPGLIIPHPWMAIRRFVLQPANEIAPDMRHPVVGWPISRLFQHLCTAPPFFCTSFCRPAFRQLVRAATDQLSAVFLEDPVEAGIFAESSRSLAEQLELLRIRAEDTRWHMAGTQPTTILAGYWWQQSLSSAKFALSAEDFELLVDYRDELEAGMPQIKLLFLPNDTPEFTAHATALHQGPWLEIDLDDAERAVHGIVAAISGMH